MMFLTSGKYTFIIDCFPEGCGSIDYKEKPRLLNCDRGFFRFTGLVQTIFAEPGQIKRKKSVNCKLWFLLPLFFHLATCPLISSL